MLLYIILHSLILFFCIVLLVLSIIQHLFIFIPIVILLLSVEIFSFWKSYVFLKEISSLVESLSNGDFSKDLAYKSSDVYGRILSQLNSAIRKVGEFERLRQERVLLYYRALSLILRRMEEPVIWIDLEKDFFRLNPRAQALFEIEQDEYKFSGILNLSANDVFSSWIKRIIDSSEIVPDEFACEIALPVSRRPKMLYINAVVVKTGEEKVQVLFLFLKEA